MLFTVSIQDIQNMDKENASSLLGNPPMRLTRARTKSLGQSGRLQGMYPTAKSDGNRPLRSNFKREATDESKPPNNAADRLHKKRAVLKDVSNVVCETYLTCVNATKIQRQLRKCGKKAPSKRNAKVGPALLEEKPQVQEEKKESPNEKTEEDMILRESSKAQISTHSDKIINTSETFLPDNMPVKHNGSNHVHLQNLSKTENRPSEKDDCLDRLGIIDIDSQNKDPLMCGIYAPSIYQNMNTMELDRRPSIDYMENLQVDITEGMRGILIDWLVEVSEEYKLVPDTLYLTVNLIDRFLSGNHVEKQKLQLLGVTCMLIASKYEEICAPRVEEFCFITDNSYTKEEVVKTESKVLNFLSFQLSVPTSKKFLRRFIQVAQISYKVPSVELEFLANYLGELTLLKYSFLKFLPSLIAASAVFLARWVLNQSDHPWNFTMEHYTGYKTMELKTTVLALQELLLNTNGCSLNAIREKYKQEKFKRVANLSASKSVQSLFN